MTALKTIIERLNELKGAEGTLRLVDGAAALPAAADQIKTTRSAYVTPGPERPGGNPTATTMVVRQQVFTRFNVFLCFTARDALGAKALDDVSTVRDAVKGKLIGWQPDGEISPITYVAGNVVEFDVKAGVIVYLLTFENYYYERKTGNG